MPAYDDVRPALAALRAAGVRLVALTNSPLVSVQSSLEYAGIAEFFEAVLSCDTIRRYKPSPEPYRMAADRLEIDIGEMIMVAAHAWDVAGAMKAGCIGAFVARPGQVLDPLFARPTIVGTDMHDVAERILEQISGPHRARP